MPTSPRESAIGLPTLRVSSSASSSACSSTSAARRRSRRPRSARGHGAPGRKRRLGRRDRGVGLLNARRREPPRSSSRSPGCGRRSSARLPVAREPPRRAPRRAQVLAFLGMPEDADRERFDGSSSASTVPSSAQPASRGPRRSARSPGGGATSRARARRGAPERGSRARASRRGRTKTPGVCLWLLVPDAVRQVLDEIAAERDVQHLASRGRRRAPACPARAQPSGARSRPGRAPGCGSSSPGAARRRSARVDVGSPPEKTTPSSAASVSSIASSLGGTTSGRPPARSIART